MNAMQQDPLSDFFTSEWAKERPLSPDFSAAVLKKITVNRYKEWLFNFACITLAVAGLTAVLLFIYPQVFDSLYRTALQVGSALREAFSIQIRQPENLFMSGLFIYLVFLTAALWGIDQLLRRRRQLHTTLCL